MDVSRCSAPMFTMTAAWNLALTCMLSFKLQHLARFATSQMPLLTVTSCSPSALEDSLTCAAERAFLSVISDCIKVVDMCHRLSGTPEPDDV